MSQDWQMKGDRRRSPWDEPDDTGKSLGFWIFLSAALIASVIAASFAYHHWAENRRAEIAAEAIRSMGEQLIREEAARSAAAAARRDLERAAAAEQDRQRRLLEAQRQREAEARKRAAMDAQQRRDEAWSRFYRQPKRCTDNPTSQVMMECANEHIRKRREFEALYDAGRL